MRDIYELLHNYLVEMEVKKQSIELLTLSADFHYHEDKNKSCLSLQLTYIAALYTDTDTPMNT